MMMEREKETMSDVERKKMTEKIILYFKSCVKIKKNIFDRWTKLVLKFEIEIVTILRKNMYHFTLLTNYNNILCHVIPFNYTFLI
jgi:hypothetical protein